MYSTNFRIEARLLSGSEWFDLGKVYETEKARGIALSTMRKGEYPNDRFEYREAKK